MGDGGGDPERHWRQPGVVAAAAARGRPAAARAATAAFVLASL